MKPFGFLEKRYWKFGKIFGIELRFHWSSFIHFCIVIGVSFLLLVRSGINLSVTDLVVGSIVGGLLFTLSLFLHELSHSFVAAINGIPVTSINIFALGMIARIKKNPDTAKVDAKMSLAGPVSSLFLAGLFFIPAAFLQNSILWSAVFSMIFVLNLILAGFSLLPGLPLDGGRIFRAILWAKLKDFKKAHLVGCRSGQIIGGLLAITGFSIFFLDFWTKFGIFRWEGILPIVTGWFIFREAKKILKKRD